MGLIQKSLSPGEEILLEAQLHSALWLLPIAQFVLMGFVVAVALGGAFFAGESEATAAFGIVGLVAAVLAGGNGLIWLFLVPNHIGAYLGSEFVVTNQRVVRKYGLIRAGLQELPLDKVESLTVSQKGIWGRMLGYGEIRVNGMGGSSFEFTHVTQPMKFRREALDILAGVSSARQG